MNSPKVAALALFAFSAAFPSCRSANGPASGAAVEAVAPPQAPVLALEGAIGSPAAAIYDASVVSEANDAGILKKSYAGRLVLRCTHPGSLAAAPAISAATTCSAESPTMPTPMILRVDSDAAQALWKAFIGDGVWHADRSVFEKLYAADDAEFICAKNGGQYRCTAGPAGSSRNVSNAGSSHEVLSLMGGRASVAGVIWNTMAATARVTAGVSTKSVSGRFAVNCNLDGLKPSCTASRTPPVGTLGTPPAPFLKVEGLVAKGLFDALLADAQGKTKAFATEAGELSCGQGGNEQYSCTIHGLAAPTNAARTASVDSAAK